MMITGVLLTCTFILKSAGIQTQTCLYLTAHACLCHPGDKKYAKVITSSLRFLVPLIEFSRIVWRSSVQEYGIGSLKDWFRQPCVQNRLGRSDAWVCVCVSVRERDGGEKESDKRVVKVRQMPALETVLKSRFVGHVTIRHSASAHSHFHTTSSLLLICALAGKRSLSSVYMKCIGFYLLIWGVLVCLIQAGFKG